MLQQQRHVKPAMSLSRLRVPRANALPRVVADTLPRVQAIQAIQALQAIQELQELHGHLVMLPR